MAVVAAPQLTYGGLTSAARRSWLRQSAAAAAAAAAARALASRASRASRCSLALRPPRRPRFRSGGSGARGGGGGGNSKSDSSPSEHKKNCLLSDICKRGARKKTPDNRSRMVTRGNLRAMLAVADGEPHSSLPTVLVHRHCCLTLGWSNLGL